MDDWKNKRWQVCASILEPGRGGIAVVARMTLRTLVEAGADVDIFSLLDPHPTNIIDKSVRAFSGSKIGFAAACHRASINHDWFLYDAVGPARAHARIPGLRRPYCVWIHGVEVWHGLSAARERALRGADLVLSNSEFTLQRFQQKHFKLNNAHVCRLATETDTGPIARAEFEGQPTVLILARIDRDQMYKGHRELINAWPKVVSSVKGAQLIIAGGGSGLDEVRNMALESPVADSIKVLGHVPGDKLDALWRSAHVFAMPSRGEGFGLVYVEAMRYGIPVIASTHDAGQEVNIDGKTGFNVDLNSASELTTRIVQLLSDRSLAHKMGLAGYSRWNEEFRFSAFRARLSSILNLRIR